MGTQCSNCSKYELLIKLSIFVWDTRYHSLVRKYEQAIFQPTLKAGQINTFSLLFQSELLKDNQVTNQLPVSNKTFTMPQMQPG